MRRLALALLTAMLTSLGTASCGEPPPPPPPRKDNTPQWADVFEGTPDVFASIRPQALKKDGVYGQFWQSLLRVASARGFTRGTTMVEALEGADEVILGLSTLR